VRQEPPFFIHHWCGLSVGRLLLGRCGLVGSSPRNTLFWLIGCTTNFGNTTTQRRTRTKTFTGMVSRMMGVGIGSLFSYMLV
jgi:hypothetical protein